MGVYQTDLLPSLPLLLELVAGHEDGPVVSTSTSSSSKYCLLILILLIIIVVFVSPPSSLLFLLSPDWFLAGCNLITNT